MSKFFTLKSTSDPRQQVQSGPSILRTISPEGSLTWNLGRPKKCHFCSIIPITFPDGNDTEILFEKVRIKSQRIIKIYLDKIPVSSKENNILNT